MIIDIDAGAITAVCGGNGLGIMLNPPYGAVLAAQALLEQQEQSQDSSTAPSGTN